MKIVDSTLGLQPHMNLATSKYHASGQCGDGSWKYKVFWGIMYLKCFCRRICHGVLPSKLTSACFTGWHYINRYKCNAKV